MSKRIRVEDLDAVVNDELSEMELSAIHGGAAPLLRFTEIKGESTEPTAHKDWINLLSVSQSITRPMGG